MSKKVKAIVVNRPKIDVDGRTDVVLRDKAGAITPMGYVLQTRNSGVYRAHTLEDEFIGSEDTRSRAMHLIQRNFEGREAKRALGRGPVATVLTAGDVIAAPLPTPAVAPAGLTCDEAAAKLGISKGALQKRIKRGTVKTTEDGLVILD